MAENEVPASTAAPEAEKHEQPSTAVTEGTNAQDTAPISKEDEAIAGKEATTEVNAPEGDAKAEAAIGPSAIEESTDTSGTKEKKKKSSGVPEHKSKKLNKKKSQPTLRLDSKPGDLYWARLKGYPPWPAVICDEQMLPETLLASRPVSAARPDGSLREDFQDGGKNAKDRTYPIMFLSTNEFAWLVNTSLTPLDPEECKKPGGKLSKSLQAAYNLAAESPDLDHFKNLLQQFQKETAEIEAELRAKEEEAAEKAAAKAEKAAENKEKKARKSKGGEEDADGDAPKASKKRKKEADSDGDAKGKKLPKITKLNAPKEPNGSATKKTTTTKPKKRVSAPKPDAEDGEAQPEMTESERLQQREKHILYFRHQLQKVFLSKTQAPKEDEMPNMNDFFSQLESYNDLEPNIIRNTKIHKVLKGIVKLDSVPRDGEFNFQKRSQAMLEAWNKRMEADGENNAKSAEKAATNGDAAPAGESKDEKAEAKDEKAEAKDEKSDTKDEKSEEKTERTIEAKAEESPAKAEEPAKSDEPKVEGLESTVDGDVIMEEAGDKPAVEA